MERNMFKLEDSKPRGAVIKVVGVGGGGGNAVDHMVRSGVGGVDFICANTDAQALDSSSADKIIQLGNNLTKGLGAGASPDVGREAAMEDRDRIIEVLQGADMVFVTAGMGGGTGTGAAPVIAQLAKELGILTVAVVTKPFSFEGRRRMKIAEEGMLLLREHVDSLITIPNEKLLAVLGGNTPLLEAFKAANNVLQGAVKGISDLIVKPGIINVDFADVRTVMSENGMAMMGTGIATGENRAVEAAKRAIASPLLEDVDMDGARGVLVNITASDSLSLEEYMAAGDIISEMAVDDAHIITGTAIDPEAGDNVVVTVVVTGLGNQKELRVVPGRTRGRVLPQKPDGNTDYTALDTPPGMRNQQAESAKRVLGSDITTSVSDEQYIDIPTFLRRQAD